MDFLERKFYRLIKAYPGDQENSSVYEIFDDDDEKYGQLVKNYFTAEEASEILDPMQMTKMENLFVGSKMFLKSIDGERLLIECIGEDKKKQYDEIQELYNKQNDLSDELTKLNEEHSRKVNEINEKTKSIKNTISRLY
jgi:hypothetical protein